MLIFDTLRQQIGVIFVVLATGFAFWRGGRPERICAAALLAAWLASPFLIDTRDWVDPQWTVLAIDAALLAVFLWFALRSDRFWPICGAALMGLDVIVRISMVVDRHIIPQAYMTAAAMWAYLVVLTLVVGTAVEVRRPSRAGASKQDGGL
jgi:hypothetical protein